MKPLELWIRDSKGSSGRDWDAAMLFMPEGSMEGDPQFWMMNERLLGALIQRSAFFIKGA